MSSVELALLVKCLVHACSVPAVLLLFAFYEIGVDNLNLRGKAILASAIAIPSLALAAPSDVTIVAVLTGLECVG